jgi:hypothetical protein
MKFILSAVAIAIAFATGPAFADCAADIQKIQEAMKSTTLDEANKAKADELMQKAMAAQDAKDETGCATSTKEVLAMLGM